MKKFGKIIALSIAVIMCVALLVACGPSSNPDKARKALEDDGYIVMKINPDSIGVDEDSLPKDLECIISGTKVKDEELVVICYFKTAKAASDAWEEIQKEAEEQQGNEEDSDWVCEKSGKMIYYGTKDAVKAAR